MQSDAFTHAFQSTTFTVSEFEEGLERLDTYLQALANKLNSNQAFEADDSFTMKTTFMRTPAPGSGNGKRYKPSSAAVRGIAKHSRITIKNRDELCCARAIVTMKALIDANDVITIISNRVILSGSGKPRPSTGWQGYPRDHVASLNSKNSKRFSLIMK